MKISGIFKQPSVVIPRRGDDQTYYNCAAETSIAKPYSAPLTKSAVEASNLKATRQLYTDYLISHLVKMAESGDLGECGFVTAPSFTNSDAPSKRHSVKPDVSLDSSSVYIRGIVKCDLPSLTSSETVAQIASYCDELNDIANILDTTPKTILAFSTPFCLQGIARQCVENAMRTYGRDFFANIDIIYVTELTDHVLEAPRGWQEMLNSFKPFTDHVVLSQFGVYEIEDAFISTDEILFDGKNARLIGFDQNAELSQSECYSKLLADGDSRDRQKSVQRRIQIASGSINEPIIVKRLAEGGYRTYEGNSRVAYAKDILAETASAPGYEKIRAKIFPADTPDEVLEFYKQECQSQIRLEHGLVQDAADMYRKSMRGMSTDEISDSFGGMYSDAIIEGSVGTVCWMKSEGILDDASIAKGYLFAYKLHSIVAPKKSYWHKQGVEMADILRAAMSPNADPMWHKNSSINRLVKVLNCCTRDWAVEAVRGFIDQTEEWATFRKWCESYEKLEAAHISQVGIKQASARLATSLTQIDNIQEYLHTMRDSLALSESKEEDKKIIGDYSQKARKELRSQIRALRQVLKSTTEVMSDIEDLISDHTEQFA